MPWKELTTMSQREAFVQQASQKGANLTHPCRTYGISRKTGYKWLRRYQAAGASGLQDRSRRPGRSPQRTPAAVEHLILQAREQHPAWGARKLKHWLMHQGYQDLPAVSTMSAILRRHGCIDRDEACKHRAYCRFERDQPNALWQMDFKGDWVLEDGTSCYPLTVLDDHSRFLVGLVACPDPTVPQLWTAPGAVDGQRLALGNSPQHPYTAFSVWLMRPGIQVLHGRPYHPQTQGKVERLHRTLQAELLSRRSFQDLPDCQTALHQWRESYIHQRPHEAVDDQVPAAGYQPSAHPFPDPLSPISYSPADWVRKVGTCGRVSFQGRACRVGKAFRGQPVAIRPHALTDGVFEVYFVNTRIAVLDFNVNHYPLS